MSAPSQYLDAADLKAALAGGLLNEDVRQQVYNLDKDIPTPFTDMVGTDSHSNPYSEWNTDDYAAPNTNNAVVSGSDSAGNKASVGARVGNHSQISTWEVQVTTRGEAVDSVGDQGTMAYQTAKGTNQLRRDIEAIALTNQASIADDNNTQEGRTGAFGAWLKSNDFNGAGGSSGGFNTGTKVVDAPTPGTSRALTMALLRDGVEGSYTAGGQVTTAMSVPKVIKGLVTFLMSSAGEPFRAKPVANVSGNAPTDQTAQGWIEVIKTDFGFVLKLVPNRLQPTYGIGSPAAPEADLFLIDPRHVALSYLYGYKVDPLAKLGLSERKLISADWMVKVFREDAHAVIRAINTTAPVTAS